MQDTDKTRFKTALMGACELYDKKMTQSLAKVYWGATRHLSIDQFESAITAHMLNPDNGQFFPKPADLIRQISGTTNQQNEQLTSKAELAWSVVYSSIQRVGPYRNLDLDDKVALVAVKNIGGWKSICSKTEQELVWLKKDFIGMYETFETTNPENLPQSLPGIEQLENNKIESSSNFAGVLQELKERNGGDAIKHIAKDTSWAE